MPPRIPSHGSKSAVTMDSPHLKRELPPKSSQFSLPWPTTPHQTPRRLLNAEGRAAGLAEINAGH